MIFDIWNYLIIFDAIILIVALFLGFKIRKVKTQVLVETLPNYVLKQSKVFQASMNDQSKEESQHAYIEIQNEKGKWVKPTEPISFLATKKFRITFVSIVILMALGYLYFAILR